MRIGLNLLHALPEIGGAWNYIAGLLNGIAECDTTNTYVGFVTPSSRVLLPTTANFIPVEVPVHSKSRPRRILYENTALQSLARKHRLDLMHWLANTRGIINVVPAAVTFYDLMVFARPDGFTKLKRTYLQAMMQQTVQGAEMLLPMSESTAGDMKRVLGASSDHMTVIPPILSSAFAVADNRTVNDFRERHALPEQFWLYVAHFYPHKNHLGLLEAYHSLKANGAAPWPLVLCGDLKGNDEIILAAIHERQLEESVTLISAGYRNGTERFPLSSEELSVLYAAAGAQVFPSLFEGAGIPVLEAMACGCPLLASDIAPVKEFARDAAVYFDAKDVSGMSEAMMQFQLDGEIREKCRARGLARAAEYRAAPVVGRLLNAYEKTVLERRRA